MAAGSRQIDNVDPATGQVISQIPRGTAKDVDVAVKAARAAQPAWAALDIDGRCDVLVAIADEIQRSAAALAQAETMDTGKPITTSTTIDIPRAEANFRFFAEYARNWGEERFEMEGGVNITHRKPVGVAGLISPWNLPLYLLTWKVAPALAMGNAVVAKPSELTPTTASMLVDIAAEAGLPDGLLNVVQGYGPEAGQALVEHPDVGAISFTGGTATGRVVAATAAPMFKKLSLELGGKNPSIVFDDVALDDAVAGVARAGFTNTGQICLCGSRVLVHEAIAEPFTDALIDRVASMRLGDPLDPATELGPVVSHGHRDKVESYVELARHEATVHGGGRPEPATLSDDTERAQALDDGAFLQPAVITRVEQTSRCVQEEIFGPVVTVQSFADEAESVALANGVDYGLAASVWTADDARARRVAEALDTGMVWTNDWLVRDLRVPFGGMKQSGVGREGGGYSLSFFSEARNLYFPGDA